MTCTARQYVRFLPCWQPATAWAFQPRIFDMIPVEQYHSRLGGDGRASGLPLWPLVLGHGRLQLSAPVAWHTGAGAGPLSPSTALSLPVHGTAGRRHESLGG